MSKVAAPDKRTSCEPSVTSELLLLSRSELVARVVRSEVFSRSERLASLLTFVCDMALNGRGAELNEQRIGIDVFGRAPNYDSSVDGIVRTQASRLRQRLELFYSGEGAAEPIRIVVPKGGYVPVFVEQPVLDPPQPLTSAEEPPLLPAEELAGDEDTPPQRRWLQLLPWLVCALLAAVTGLLLLQRHSRPPLAPRAEHPLWSRIFTPGHPTLEVPGDSGLVLSYAFTQKGVTLSEYLAGRYREGNQARSSAFEPTGFPDIQTDVTNRRYTSIVDLQVAVHLEELALAQGSSLQVRYARDLRPNDLKNVNAILIGALEGNPWLEMFEPRMNFVLTNNYRTHVFTVLNRAPKPGEPSHWESTNGSPQSVYGVIALRPNLSNNGELLILEGTSMAGVEAAWDFVSDDAELLPLLHAMQRPDGKLPHFEILVGTQNMGASATHGELVAWRSEP